MYKYDISKIFLLREVELSLRNKSPITGTKYQLYIGLYAPEQLKLI